MKNKKIKIAIIGCGNIAKFHVKAFKAVGLNITDCASSLNSKTLHNFAKKYQINNCWHNPYELAKSAKKFDGVILCAPSKFNHKILDILIENKVPTLVEKPVSTNINYLKKFKVRCPNNIIVGFHRRYYFPVKKAKNFVKSSKSKINCFLKLPEKIFDIPNKRESLREVFENSVHGFDLLLYLFGDLNLVFAKKTKLIGNIFNIDSYFKTKNQHSIRIQLSPNSPDNFYLEMENDRERFLIKPFEEFYHYHGMKVVDPSKKYPLRKYIPNIIDKGSVFSELNDFNQIIKPGFYEQALSFKKMINKNKFNFDASANLKDAYKAQVLIRNFLDFN